MLRDMDGAAIRRLIGVHSKIDEPGDYPENYWSHDYYSADDRRAYVLETLTSAAFSDLDDEGSALYERIASHVSSRDDWRRLAEELLTNATETRLWDIILEGVNVGDPYPDDIHDACVAEFVEEMYGSFLTQEQHDNIIAINHADEP